MGTTDLHVIWGRRLEDLRRQKRLTGAALAREAGISRQHLQAIETGQSVASDEVRLALAKALGVPAADIFDYDDALETA